MNDNKSKHKIIKDAQQISLLLSDIKTEKFADSFQFETEELRETFLKAAIPDNIDFEEKYYYFDKDNQLHISESEFGYFWISTMGLVPTSKFSDNTFVNAFLAQETVIRVLLDSTETLIASDGIYDIDSFANDQLKYYTPAIWQNIVFFFETFGKAYLSISGRKIEYVHNISEIFDDVRKTMFDLYQNNTLFHAYIIPEFEALSDYIKKIPGNFNEAFIKYDANQYDTTCFPFSKESISSMKNMISLCVDFILNYYYSKNDAFYLTPGVYDRLIQNATDNSAKKSVEDTWGFLKTSQEDTKHADA